MTDATLDATWRRSHRGNLWTTADEGRLTLTVFERPKGSGWYAFCIADADGPLFSERSYPCEADAVEGCLAELARVEP